MTTKAKMWLIVILDVLLLAFLFVASSTDWIFTEQKQTSYKISVLMEENDTATQYFVAGVQEAAIAKNIDVHVLSFTDEQSLAEKSELLQKQLEKGTQGLVLCLEEDDEVQELLADVPTSVPVVSWGRNLYTDNVYANVGYDVQLEGELLTEAWLMSERKNEVAYVTLGNESQADIEFYEKLQYTAEEKGFAVEILELEELSGAKTLVQGMAIESKRILVTRDMELLAALSEAVIGLQVKIPLYGIGYADGIRNGLEKGAIHGIVAHRDYEGGYIVLCQMANALQQKMAPKESILVGSAIITQENMYGAEEETIIFPYK